MLLVLMTTTSENPSPLKSPLVMATEAETVLKICSDWKSEPLLRKRLTLPRLRLRTAKSHLPSLL